MAKKLLAVCDNDLEYVNRFMAYMKEKGNLPFRVAGFSSAEALDVFLERNKIDVLLLSDRYKDSAGASKESGRDIQAHFREHPGIYEMILFGDKQDLLSRQKYLFKYRSIENIIFDITTNFQIFMAGDNEKNGGEMINVLGIYPASDHSRKQAFSLALSRTISNSTSLLYLDLERFPGMVAGQAGESGGQSISDLIYYFKTDPRKIRENLGNAVKRIDNFDILFAPSDMEDMDLLDDEELADFLFRVAAAGGYEMILLDMSEAFRRIENIFHLCNAVYVTTQEDYYSRNRTRNLKEYIAVKEGTKMFEKIKEVPVDKIEDALLCEDTQEYLETCFFGTAAEIAEGIYYG